MDVPLQVVQQLRPLLAVAQVENPGDSRPLPIEGVHIGIHVAVRCRPPALASSVCHSKMR